MKQYLEMCQQILDKGVDRDDRTGTRSIFGHQLRFDIGFEDIELIGYDPQPTIKGEVSV